MRTSPCCEFSKNVHQGNIFNSRCRYLFQAHKLEKNHALSQYSLWQSDRIPVPWWIPEILRLQRLEYDLWMHQTGLGRMRTKLAVFFAISNIAYLKQNMRIANSIKSWAKKVKQDSVMLWFAQKHPQTPVMAKIVCVLAVAYALSPIDLIPDFIPVIGYLDDALLVPALIWIAVKLIPKNVLEECRAQASEWIEKDNKKPRSYIGAIAIIIIWIALFGWGIWFWTR